ncbi:ZN836-like protein [Mya arenaria]|uniref:ZN836-like protein n=1 Tax=Mya arenaria TaxID=6604 RepID=A0ABY7FR54_MYAAR|nr:ZN836-like protein [Mya arenaria]
MALLLTTRPPYRCKICQKTFNQTSSLYTHHTSFMTLLLTTIHSRSIDRHMLVCNIILSTFPKDIELPIHRHTDIKSSIGGLKMYMCVLCGKSFPTPSKLDAHAVVHTGERPYTCDICQRSYTHCSIKNVGKIYPCTVCRKCFPTPSALSSHKITHSNVKPYGCKVCNKRFKGKRSLAGHMSSQHGEDVK